MNLLGPARDGEWIYVIGDFLAVTYVYLSPIKKRTNSETQEN